MTAIGGGGERPPEGPLYLVTPVGGLGDGRSVVTIESLEPRQAVELLKAPPVTKDIAVALRREKAWANWTRDVATRMGVDRRTVARVLTMHALEGELPDFRSDLFRRRDIVKQRRYIARLMLLINEFRCPKARGLPLTAVRKVLALTGIDDTDHVRTQLKNDSGLIVAGPKGLGHVYCHPATFDLVCGEMLRDLGNDTVRWELSGGLRRPA